MTEKIFIPKDYDLLDPKEDSTFKTLFIQEGEKAQIALKSLIKAIIGREPKTVRVLNSELPKDIKRVKDIRLDLQCEMEDNDRINIEMQTCHGDDNLKNRVLYYATRMMSTFDMKNKPYSVLPKVYHVMFTNFQLFNSDNRYLQTFKLQNDAKEEMTECMQFIFVQLNLFKINGRKINNLLDIEKWIIFLRDSADKEKRDLLNSIMASDKGIREAGEILMNISKDAKAWARQEMRFKARQDREAEEALHRMREEKFAEELKQAEEKIRQAHEQVKQAEEQAKEAEKQAKQAHDQAKQAQEQALKAYDQAMIEAAKGMKAKKIPIETIIEITSLTAEQIEAL
jgi:predicted transposase/invertase (TIGR01784 family)